jgi:ribonuclease HI
VADEGILSIYGDGSSTGRSDGPGGWAFVVTVDGRPRRAAYGGDPLTTNNRMEIRALIEGLKAVEREFAAQATGGYVIELVSDSQLALGMASGAFNPTKNIDLVEELRALVLKLKIKRFRWVKGHAGHPLNERVDRLAKKGKEEASVGYDPWDGDDLPC